MLTRLSVKNLAVVADVVVEFGPRLNVISGETGAGKSLLMGALGLAVGDRASSSLVRPGADRARVDAVFDPIDGARVDELLVSLGLEPMEDGWLAIRRDITAEGKSRAFVGETQVRLSTLKAIGDLLVDRHGQGDHQRLYAPAWQRDCLDVVGKATKERDKLRTLHEREAALTATIDAIRTRHEKVRREREFFEHQLREIDAAELSAEEEAALRDERRLMTDSSRLVEDAATVVEELAEADTSAMSRLDRAARALDDIVAVDSELLPVVELLGSARLEMEEVAARVRDRVASLEFSAERRDEVERRLDLVNTLKRKYGRDVEEILGHAEELRAALQADADADLEAAESIAEREAVRAALGKAADSLLEKRTRAAAALEKAVEKALPELGMGGASFEVGVTSSPGGESWFSRKGVPVRIGPSGAEEIEFRLAANPGQRAEPLGAAASGGETSRLALALRVLLSDAAHAEVQILDEVDTGIGGKTARSVGRHIHKLAENRQVIAITHLAAVASHADHHYRIDKAVSGGKTSITIDALGEKERVQEIARMLSGGDEDATARRHARALIKEAQKV